MNAFTAVQASQIVGMSTHMLNYLARQDYLVPTYFRSGRRGRTRYYSYRDLVVARMVQKLLDAGLEISRLKNGLKKIQRSEHWVKNGIQRTLRLLATDGRSLFFLSENDALVDLTRQGQMTFAFVLDVAAAQKEVQANMDADQLSHFNLENKRIKFVAA